MLIYTLLFKVGSNVMLINHQTFCHISWPVVDPCFGQRRGQGDKQGPRPRWAPSNFDGPSWFEGFGVNATFKWCLHMNYSGRSRGYHGQQSSKHTELGQKLWWYILKWKKLEEFVLKKISTGPLGFRAQGGHSPMPPLLDPPLIMTSYYVQPMLEICQMYTCHVYLYNTNMTSFW